MMIIANNNYEKLLNLRRKLMKLIQISWISAAINLFLLFDYAHSCKTKGLRA